MIDESCKGEGATHNACSCVLDRMAKLEAVARAAETIHGIPNQWDRRYEDLVWRPLHEALAALKDHVGDPTEKVCDAKGTATINDLGRGKPLEWKEDRP